MASTRFSSFSYLTCWGYSFFFRKIFPSCRGSVQRSVRRRFLALSMVHFPVRPIGYGFFLSVLTRSLLSPLRGPSPCNRFFRCIFGSPFFFLFRGYALLAICIQALGPLTCFYPSDSGWRSGIVFLGKSPTVWEKPLDSPCDNQKVPRQPAFEKFPFGLGQPLFFWLHVSLRKTVDF